MPDIILPVKAISSTTITTPELSLTNRFEQTLAGIDNQPALEIVDNSKSNLFNKIIQTLSELQQEQDTLFSKTELSNIKKHNTIIKEDIDNIREYDGNVKIHHNSTDEASRTKDITNNEYINSLMKSAIIKSDLSMRTQKYFAVVKSIHATVSAVTSSMKQLLKM